MTDKKTQDDENSLPISVKLYEDVGLGVFDFYGPGGQEQVDAIDDINREFAIHSFTIKLSRMKKEEKKAWKNAGYFFNRVDEMEDPYSHLTKKESR